MGYHWTETCISTLQGLICSVQHQCGGCALVLMASLRMRVSESWELGSQERNPWQLTGQNTVTFVSRFRCMSCSWWLLYGILHHVECHSLSIAYEGCFWFFHIIYNTAVNFFVHICEGFFHKLFNFLLFFLPLHVLIFPTCTLHVLIYLSVSSLYRTYLFTLSQKMFLICRKVTK